MGFNFLYFRVLKKVYIVEMLTGSPPTSSSGWPVTGLCMPAGLAISGNIVYAPYIVDDSNQGQQVWVLKINKNNGTYTENQLFGNDTIHALTVDGQYLYMSRSGEYTQISERRLTDLSSVRNFVYESWPAYVLPDGFGGYIDVMVTPTPALGIVVIGNYIYASHYSDGYNEGGVISRINKNTFAFDSTFGNSTYGYNNLTSSISPVGLATDGTYLYIANTLGGNIIRMTADGLATTLFKTGLSGIKGLTFSDGYLYATLSNSVVKIQVSVPANMTTVASLGLDIPLELAVSGSYIYVANTSDSQRGNYPIRPSGFIGRYGFGSVIPCFKEDTKILTDRGYIPVQDLKQRDLVQTSKDGFRPIYLIGKTQVVHNSETPAKDSLYKCSKDKYPEIFEDLIITGSHAVLVFPFKEGEEEETKKFYGRIYVTDKKYRLPVCLDKRASKYEHEGTYNIYHIALENENLLMNYGIYANGLLVESCSKTDIKIFF